MCITPFFLTNLGIYVRCGRCIDCRLARTREWADRLMVENHTFKQRLQFPGASLTLTYDKEHLPLNNKGKPTLVKDAVSKFMKRLRKRIRFYKIKCYYSGEYGAKRGRPHYHVILMGVHPYIHKKFFQESWGQGHVHVDPLVQRTVAYAAGYIQKKLYSKNNEYYFSRDKVPPFSAMSKGIGKDYCLSNADTMIEKGGYRINGYMRALPRYFRKLLGITGLTGDAYKSIDEKEQYIIERAQKEGIQCFLDEGQHTQTSSFYEFCDRRMSEGLQFNGRPITNDFAEYLERYRNQHKLNLEEKYRLWRTKLCDIIHNQEMFTQELSGSMLSTTLLVV